ncbi:hypothetical protein U1Q18_017243 [Sarracenia purpurea var. burkii]
MEATTKISRRRGPLHTCGVSISAIACKAYTKAQDFNGPIGSITKRMAKLAAFTFPILYAFQYQWLASLSFADDQILAVENITEALFPPSTRLFDKIDEFVGVAETLPGKFDDAMSKLPVIISQIPFMDWAQIYLVSWLKFLISTLTQCGSENTKEKEIVVDMTCTNLNKELESAENSIQDESEIVSQERCLTDSRCENVEGLDFLFGSQENEIKRVQTTDKSEVMKCSYKEILEKGKKEDTQRGENDIKEDNPNPIAIASERGAVKISEKGKNEGTEKEENNIKEDNPNPIAIASKREAVKIGEKGKKEGTEREENNIKEGNANPIAIAGEREAVKISKKDENRSDKSIEKEDPILKLFDSSWHMKARK